MIQKIIVAVCILIVAALLLMLGGCADRVTHKGIQLAYEKCEAHGGLRSVQPHAQAFADSHPYAICNDGLMLDLSDLLGEVENLQ